MLVRKFEDSVAAHFGAKQTESIKRMFSDRAALAGRGKANGETLWSRRSICGYWSVQASGFAANRTGVY